MPRLYSLFQTRIITLQCQQHRKKVLFQFQSTSYFSTSRQQKVHQQYTQSSSSSNGFGRDHQYHYYENVVTENTILSAFPRPNLTPTLHHTLIENNAFNNNNNNNQQKNKIKCKNCQGPHNSAHCPC